MVDIEKILEKFEDDLNQFETVEEKVEYLNSFGFVVKSPKDDKNFDIESTKNN